MARFWTSDLHLGHANIIRYCHRPFADVDAMNAALIDRWNDTVEDSDEVWVLGDFALGAIAEMLPLAQRLRGTKVLVAGNHDRCWAGWGERSHRWIETYLDAGFDEVLQGWVPITIGGRPARACHLPYEGDSHDDDLFVSQRPTDDGTLLLHGHVHDQWRVDGHQVNVGVDVWDYRPVSDDMVLQEYVRAQ
ncbi:MAG: metallophosphoesterase [Ilumatobacteraceae bacterium]|nr:metallophosphoesterase [Ilumatobacteraceae bacterium]